MLTYSIGKKSLTIDLAEAKVSEKRLQLQSLLFDLSDKCDNLEKELQRVKDEAKAAKIRPSVGVTPAGKRDKQKQPKAGMSVLNPGARKRKAAKGVNFD